ncbi:MAG: HIRAN domain-containing protein [Bryobacterales bacterium]|nr:HIRAN domain-containing protein [Bryobacterales bacterium]
MTDKTLFLAWQDKRMTRSWFPVGRLDVLKEPRLYQFRYIHGAETAHRDAGFEPLLDFPEWKAVYKSPDLFPLFQNRVISSERRDFTKYLELLDLPDTAEPAEILEVGGGHRATDNFEVFPKIERREDGSFRCRFFLHGARHVSKAAIERIDLLQPGDPLYVALELTNPATRLAVQIQTTDYHVIGWAPRYLVGDLVSTIAQSPGNYAARVVRRNPSPAPSKQRLLVEFTGSWPDNYDPMSGSDFKPLPSE